MCDPPHGRVMSFPTFSRAARTGPPRPPQRRRLSLRALTAPGRPARLGAQRRAARDSDDPHRERCPVRFNPAVAGAGRRLYPPRLVQVPKTGGPRRTVTAGQPAARRAGRGYGPPASRTKPGHRPNPPTLRASVGARLCPQRLETVRVGLARAVPSWSGCHVVHSEGHSRASACARQCWWHGSRPHLCRQPPGAPPTRLHRIRGPRRFRPLTLEDGRARR